MTWEPRKAWGLDCCWVCHKELMTPLHLARPRTMGLKRIHVLCFSEGVFATLGVEELIVVSDKRMEEMTIRNPSARRKDRQQDLFNAALGDIDGQEEDDE